MSHRSVLVSDAFRGLSEGVLFYPSAGTDLDLPLRVFRPWLNEFWFVDPSYDVDKRYGPRDLFLENVQLEETDGATLRCGTPYRITIRHEVYRTDAGDAFSVHACRGRGFDVFNSQFRAKGRMLTVFFHRGDSLGEGGSNFYWLGRKRLEAVLKQLEPGGIVVSDGSLALRQFRHELDNEAPSDFSSISPFHAKGYHFQCVGYLGQRYGPTLAWKTGRESGSSFLRQDQ
jgi:hypothetical protein